MAHRTGSSIILQPNSLYIHTTPLLGNRFHWALIHVDDRGVCSRHQWAAATRDPRGREDYVEQALPRGAGPKADADVILAYFQIEDYIPIDISAFRTLCASIFPSSFPTMEQNRAADITCRTWIAAILSNLIDAPRALQIEKFVIARSTECGNIYATDFLFQRPYSLQIFTHTGA